MIKVVEKKEPWSPAPIWLTKAMMRTTISNRHQSLFHVIYHETYGQYDFNSKEEDDIDKRKKIAEISLSSFSQWTGISKNHVSELLADLKQWRIIVVVDTYRKQYKINVNISEWDESKIRNTTKQLPESGNFPDSGSSQIREQQVPRSGNNKFPDSGTCSADKTVKKQEVTKPFKNSLKSTKNTSTKKSENGYPNNYTKTAVYKLSEEKYLKWIKYHFFTGSMLRNYSAAQIALRPKLDERSIMNAAYLWLLANVDVIDGRRCNLKNLIGTFYSNAWKDFVKRAAKSGTSVAQPEICPHCQSEDSILIGSDNILDTHGCNKCNRQFKTKHRKA